MNYKFSESEFSWNRDPSAPKPEQKIDLDALASTLKRGDDFNEIYIRYPSEEDDIVGDLDFFADALRQNTTLRRLTLIGCKQLTTTLLPWIKVLLRRDQLTQLNLLGSLTFYGQAERDIAVRPLNDISDALIDNKNLQCFGWGFNLIGVEDNLFFEALPTTSIRDLSLTACTLTEGCGRVLLTVLPRTSIVMSDKLYINGSITPKTSAAIKAYFYQIAGDSEDKKDIKGVGDAETILTRAASRAAAPAVLVQVSPGSVPVTRGFSVDSLTTSSIDSETPKVEQQGNSAAEEAHVNETTRPKENQLDAQSQQSVRVLQEALDKDSSMSGRDIGSVNRITELVSCDAAGFPQILRRGAGRHRFGIFGPATAKPAAVANMLSTIKTDPAMGESVAQQTAQHYLSWFSGPSRPRQLTMARGTRAIITAISKGSAP